MSERDLRIAVAPPDAEPGPTWGGKPLGFGEVFTDRVFRAEYAPHQGWQGLRIVPASSISLHPGAAVFHYGQAVFEGMKGYAWADGDIRLFRPELNARRLYSSAQRMVMEPVPEDLFLTAVDALVDAEREWVPRGEMESLYIRPLLIATEPILGVRPSREYAFVVLLSPVGPYFPTGFEPVRIFVSDSHSRAAPGGVGNAKVAGNYAASLLAGKAAAQRGCSQVMWLDACQHRWVEEIGSMHVVFVIEGALVTPPLSDTIIPGVTRQTVLELAGSKGLAVKEERISIDFVGDAIRSGRCTEAFGCGTACVITPIRSLVYREQEYDLGPAAGPIAAELFHEISSIQYGQRPDTLGWMRLVERRRDPGS